VLEKQIERAGGDYAKAAGHLFLKFSSPGHAAVPDRLILAEIPEFLRPVIAQYVRFVEYKCTGQKPTGPQTREHLRLQALGFTVDVIDTVQGSKAMTDGMGL
jgi:hypothetical protein